MNSKQSMFEIMARDRTDQEEEKLPSAKAKETFRNATRIQESLTSVLERKTLLWLAARIPSQIGPDHLTCLGFAAMLLAGSSHLFAQWHPVGLFLGTFLLAANLVGVGPPGTRPPVKSPQ